MGHKHSKRPRPLTTQPEVTEIIELYDNHDDDDDVVITATSEPSEQIVELNKTIETLDSIERSIASMSTSQIQVYYCTFKDELHNAWRRLYDLDVATSRRTDTIERVKADLQTLNSKVLTRSVE